LYRSFHSRLHDDVVTFAEPISQFDASQERARKEYEAAVARIDAVSKADQLACAWQTGPAAKACTIQADGKRFASQEDAKLALARARDQHELSKNDLKKTAGAKKNAQSPNMASRKSG
jgi:hypothetical protein